MQDPPLGTGHAVQAAERVLMGFKGDIVITYADVPLLRSGSIQPLFDLLDGGAAIAVQGFEAADPAAYGRMIVGKDGGLDAHRRGQGRHVRRCSPSGWSIPA